MPWIRLSVLCLTVASLAQAASPQNLLRDASFESPRRVRDGGDYFAEKRVIDDAADGRSVLELSGWNARGSVYLLAPAAIDAATCSATLAVRSFDTAADATAELALYAIERGRTRKLATLATAPLDGRGAWTRLEAGAVARPEPPADAALRLGLLLRGPAGEGRVQIDRAGLFAGDEIGEVDAAFDHEWFEAESMDLKGDAWFAQEHYQNWYVGLPNGMTMLAGTKKVPPAENHPASKTVTIRRAGTHRVWMRYVVVNSAKTAGGFTVRLRQGERVVASKDIDEADQKGLRRLGWVWESIEGELEEGEAVIELLRPAAGCSWVGRKVDLLCLTDQMNYEPIIADFRPAGYLRLTNLDGEQEPYCASFFIRRHMPPWYGRPGKLSMAGFTEAYRVPADRERWLVEGRPSPWVRISDELLPAGGRNNVRLLLTRESDDAGRVAGRVRFRVELAVDGERPDEKRVVRSFDVEQVGPQLLMTLPNDFTARDDFFVLPQEYIAEQRQRIGGFLSVRGPRATHLSFTTGMSLHAAEDDPDLVGAELDILRDMSFTSSRNLNSPPADAVAFAAAHDLLPPSDMKVFGAYNAFKDDFGITPDEQKMHRIVREYAEQMAPAAAHMNKIELMDEPGAPELAALAKSPECNAFFRGWIDEQGLTAADLGVASLDDARLVTAKQKEQQPRLYYYSALLRQELFTHRVKVVTDVIHQYLPRTVRAYVNYVPQHTNVTWVNRGVDPFTAQRRGGLALGWTEDWVGHGAHPRHMAATLAVLRAAGRDEQPLGLHIVPHSGGAPLLRMKYYIAVAAGARTANLYSYGPWYAGIDSWGRRFDLHPIITDVQQELARIDDALDGTQRHPRQVAVIYNRTASLWADPSATYEFDGRFMHWALAHAGYDADFIPEEDIEAGELGRYKVLYLTGPQLRRAAAQRIAAWVEAGGTLMATAGAASRDEFNQPTDALDAVFGATCQSLEEVAEVGRPRYELPKHKAMDTFTTAAGAATPAATLPQLCVREAIRPTDGQVVFANADGAPGGVWKQTGKGQAVRLAALPGVAYLHAAVTVEGYDTDTYLPPAYPADLRALIAWPCRLAKVQPAATFDAQPMEVTRYDGDDRAVVFIVDHLIAPRDSVTIRLHGAGGFNHTSTATGSVATIKHDGDDLLLTLPLDGADAVVLKP